MSEDKDPGEEREKEADEFEFYFSFTKPLVLDLPSSEERGLAAAWVQKLEADTNDKERLNYLKLLLFILQRGRLSGIFKKQPPSGPFEPFPPGFSIIDMGNLMLDQDDTQMFGGGDTRAVPYNIEISNDLREFVASQEVPNFGIQMYYAWSADDPVQKWAHFDEDKFPQYILEKIKQLKEDRSQEKAPPTAGKKKTYDICPGDKCLKKKVKTPQEIEKSQGRSFHTYMGLVGRMGNFSKCEDDQGKGFQRPERKGSPQRKKMQRRPPTGEGEDGCAEDEYDNFVTGLGGGLTSANRPCLCPYPCHHQDCPEYRKGGPQSSDNQPGGPCPADTGYAQRGRGVRQASPQRNLREPAAECEGVTSQQRYGTTTMRTPEAPMSLNMGQDNQRGGPNKGGTCICSSAQCICPCPRAGPATKTPPCGQGAQRVPTSASRTYTKTPAQDPRCNNQFTSRSGAEYLTSLKVADNYMDRQNTPTATPVGGRSCASSPAKSLRPVTHCYDERNPDPCLTEVINRQPAMMAPQTYSGSPQPPQHGVSFKSRRKLFTPLAESTAIQDHVPQQPGGVCPAPGLMSHPECENEPQPCEEFFSLIQSEDEISEDYGQYSGGLNETFNKKTPPNPCNTANTSQANRSLFAVPDGGGRLANIASVLQGLQQKTEAHREKCASGAIRKTARADDNAGPCPAPQVSPSCGTQMGYDGGNFCEPSSQPRPGDPNMYFTPQIPAREQPNFREVQSAPTKRDDTQCMFMSNQIGYQGPPPESHIKYFPTSTPPSPPKTNLARYETFMSFEQFSENEGGYDEENYECDSSSENFYDNQAMLKTQSAPCPTESYFFSPPRQRQGPEDMSHYTPPSGQSKFQSRPQSPRDTTSACTPPRRGQTSGRPSPQPQCPPPSPQRQTQPQCPPASPQRHTQPQCPPSSPQRQGQPQCPPSSPQRQGQPQCPPSSPQRQGQPQCPPSSPQRQVQSQCPSSTSQRQGQPQCPPSSSQRQGQPQCPPSSPQRQVQPQCPPQSPHHSQDQWNSRENQQWSSPKKYVDPADNWNARGRAKGPMNMNYLTPQFPPADRGPLRPQAFSTGSKCQTAANINCPRPQAQSACQPLSFEEPTDSMQDLNYDQDCDFENSRSSDLFVEGDSYETDGDLGPCESVPQC